MRLPEAFIASQFAGWQTNDGQAGRKKHSKNSRKISPYSLEGHGPSESQRKNWQRRGRYSMLALL
jgi:hypothetical protein